MSGALVASQLQHHAWSFHQIDYAEHLIVQDVSTIFQVFIVTQLGFELTPSHSEMRGLINFAGQKLCHSIFFSFFVYRDRISKQNNDIAYVYDNAKVCWTWFSASY